MITFIIENSRFYLYRNDFNHYSFGGSGTSDSFGTFRKGSVGGRKTPQRSFTPNRGFSNFGGPDAFLSGAESIEVDDEGDRSASVFGGTSGSNFGGFSNGAPSWGKQTSAKGRSKGGLKKTAAAKVAQPAAINFGGAESSRYIDRGGFSFGASGGTGGNPPQFGEFTGANNFLGSFGNSGGTFTSGGNSGSSSFSSSSKKTFTSGGESFPNPFGKFWFRSILIINVIRDCQKMC